MSQDTFYASSNKHNEHFSLDGFFVSEEKRASPGDKNTSKIRRETSSLVSWNAARLFQLWLAIFKSVDKLYRWCVCSNSVSQRETDGYINSFIVSDDLCSMLDRIVVFYVLDLLNAERQTDLHQMSSLVMIGFSFLVRRLDRDATGTCWWSSGWTDALRRCLPFRQYRPEIQHLQKDGLVSRTEGISENQGLIPIGSYISSIFSFGRVHTVGDDSPTVEFIAAARANLCSWSASLI